MIKFHLYYEDLKHDNQHVIACTKADKAWDWLGHRGMNFLDFMRSAKRFSLICHDFIMGRLPGENIR